MEFTTKPRQAQAMIGRAIAAGVPFTWFTADETYGQAKWLQAWLEDQDVSYVMAIRCSDTLPTSRGRAAGRRADRRPSQAAPGNGCQPEPGRTARGSSTGRGSRSGPRASVAAGTGCWPAGRSATRLKSPITPATARAGPAPPTWPGSPGAAGILKSVSSKPKARPGSITTRSGPGGPGTPTSPCPCSRWPGSRPAGPRR